MGDLRQWLYRIRRHITKRPMVCRSCGYRVPYLGDPVEQAGRALDHFDAFHDATPADPKGTP